MGSDEHRLRDFRVDPHKRSDGGGTFGKAKNFCLHGGPYDGQRIVTEKVTLGGRIRVGGFDYWWDERIKCESGLSVAVYGERKNITVADGTRGMERGR